jgi:hypothetical protein
LTPVGPQRHLTQKLLRTQWSKAKLGYPEDAERLRCVRRVARRTPGRYEDGDGDQPQQHPTIHLCLQWNAPFLRFFLQRTTFVPHVEESESATVLAYLRAET